MSETKEMALKWYVASTQSGQENTVKENINKRLESSDKKDTVTKLIVAEIEEETKSKKDNKIIIKKRNLYPGYIFIEMEMSDEMWFLIRNTPGVTGFIGSSGRGAKPFPVDYEDIEPILKRLGQVDKKMYDRYNIGDFVRVIDGPFGEQEGKIVSIDSERNSVKVETLFFSRSIVVEVDFALIEKVNI